jgi:TPR repeat protein
MDVKQAFKWYLQAAQKGYAKSQASLSIRYAEGEGVVRDMVAALVWASRAADQGLDRAKSYRRKLIDKMDPKEIAEAEKRLRQ